MKKHRIITFYLPQFHPFKENNEWWGKGFTEWTNVTKTKPRFRGHYQPHLPTDLGFYDLRVPEVRAEQAEMARKYGIYGFCYYHYWFNGKLLMERPLEEILNSGEPDFPFMLCWANENWTRKWDGGVNSVLIEQKYSEEDDIKHIHYLLPFLKDPRYIRINVIEKFNPYSDEENLIFINAWNEWAEGNHLESDIKWRHGYLEATKRVLEA
jgi:lipopolysaccharide biosynthesis protein